MNGTRAHPVVVAAAFREEMVRSDRVRTSLALAVVAALLLFAILRDLVLAEVSVLTGSAPAGVDPMGHWLGRSGFVAGLLVLVVEAGALVLLTRAVRRRTAAPRWLTVTLLALESLVPSAIILGLMADESVGSRALLYPVILLYPLFIALSTLRLRPALCWVAGGISSVGYLLLTLIAMRSDLRSGAMDAGMLAVSLTVVAAILVNAWVAAAVAAQLRRRILLLLEVADEHRRAENRSRDTLIFALAKLAEHRDTDTGSHLVRIASYSAALAEAMRPTHASIDDAWIDRLRVASSLHDIGKVGLPDGVLKKPGPLTDEERKTMQSHPALGAATLHAIRDHEGATDPLLVMSEEIAAAHHERWDGSGYPNGYAGEAIPLAARIVALADVYDALTSRRVYKPPMSHEDALRLIRDGRGTQFDPAVVDAFLGIADTFDARRASFGAGDQAIAGGRTEGRRFVA